MGVASSCLDIGKKLDSRVDCYVGELTTKEFAIIHKQWAVVMRNIDGHGYTLFSKLFQHKDIMAKFDFAVANNLDYKKTLSDARLSFHVRRVFHTFNTVITCIHETEQMVTQLQHVGAIHAEYGLKFTHLKRFKDCFIDTLKDSLKDNFTNEASTAWSKLIDIIANEMMVGIKKAEIPIEHQDHTEINKACPSS